MNPSHGTFYAHSILLKISSKNLKEKEECIRDLRELWGN